MRRLQALIVVAALGLGAVALAAGRDGKIAALFEESFAYETTANMDRALNAVMQVLRLDPDDYTANLRAGWLYYAKYRHEDAKRYYRRAISLRPKAIEPKLGMMLPLMALRAWTEAASLAGEVMQRAPRNYSAASRLAFIHYSQGHYGKAEKLYAQVLEDFPGDLEMTLGLGWTYLKQGRSKQAREMFQRVLRVRRSNVSARSGLDALGKGKSFNPRVAP